MHHGALAHLLGINALRASEAAAVRIEDYADTQRGHRVLHLVGKGNKPATTPVTVPVLRALEACRGQRTSGPPTEHPNRGRGSHDDACASGQAVTWPTISPVGALEPPGGSSVTTKPTTSGPPSSTTATWPSSSGVNTPAEVFVPSGAIFHTW